MKYYLCNKSDVVPGTKQRFEVAGTPVCVVNLDGEFFAVADTCSHAEASLSDGHLMGSEIQCPMHGAYFNVKTGEVLSPPAVNPIATYTVVVEGEDLFLDTDTL